MACEYPGGRAKRGWLDRIFGFREGKADTGMLLVVSSDVMGKEPDIGRILMKGFFETLISTARLPRAVFFMNAGVRLTTTDDEFVALITKLLDAGVEIYSCGTCLKHYGLEHALRVGYRGATAQLVEFVTDMKTVWV